MKAALLAVFISYTLTTNAATYYFSANSGNDTYSNLQAQSPSTPWQTLIKFNSVFSSLQPGDSVLFKRGETFYGSLTISRSGTTALPLIIGAYGNGAKPVITGFTMVSAWTNLGGNIWESTNAISTLSTCNMVTLDGVPQTVGRFPNSDAANGGYLTYTAFSTNTTLTCSGLNGTDWTGAEVVAKKQGYILERNRITGQSGSVITYAPPAVSINPRQGGSVTSPVAAVPKSTGYGLFIQRDVRTLDQTGEWWYDTTAKKIRMYFATNPPTSYVVKVATVDTLINIGPRNYITIQNLELQGANLAAIYYQDAGNLVIKGNTINYSGAKAIFGWNTDNVLIDGNTINNSLCGGIDHTSRHASNCTIINNHVTNSGKLPGMGQFYDNNDVNGISVSVDSFAVVRKNIVDTTGYIPIQFYGSKVNVDSNFINYYGFVKDDCGGVYTFSTTHNNRTIKNNIILNGIGTSAGKPSPIYHAEGIYTDGNSDAGSAGARGIEITGNSIAYVHNRGIYMNDPKDINVRNNTTYGCKGFSINKHYADSVYNVNIKSNIFFNEKSPVGGNDQNYANTGLNSTLRPVAGTIQLALQLMASIDSNYYQFATTNTKPFKWYYYTTYGGSATFPAAVDFSTWKSYTLHDSNSASYSNAEIATQRFEYNPTSSPVIISLPFNYSDVTGATYNGTITLAPYTSAVLIKNGAIINQPPKANAGIDQTIILPTNFINLSGSGTDSDGIISSYLWTKISGSTACTIANINSASTSVTGLIQGVYKFELKVTDNNGAVGKDTMQVTVNATANIAPVANAGSGITITLPLNTTSLTGSGSDADGTIASYAWSRVSGPTTFSLASASSPTSTLSNLVQGTYVFRLTVTDNNGATATDDVTVTVNAAASQPPIANAGSNITLTSPVNSTTLTGSGSDPDGPIASYLWSRVSGPTTFTLSSANAATTILSNLVQGIYTFKLTVTDNSGATATDDVTVTVNASPNQAPTADAGNNIVLTLPTNSTTLTGIGTDPDGTISSYAWSRASGPVTFTLGTANAATTTLSNLAQGIYVFRLTVTDNKDATSSDNVTVTVNAAAVPPNRLPIVNAGPDQTIALPSNSAILDGNASYDPDGTISSYSWQQTSGPGSSAFSSTITAIITLSNLQEGTYTYRLAVSDNKNATATDTVNVTIVNNFRIFGPVALYPNPASNVINIVLNSDSAGTIRFNMYDMQGRKVMKTVEIDKPRGFFTSSINVSHLRSGAYTLERITATYRKMVSKFIKL